MSGPQDDDEFDPLARGGASLPPVLGAGCAARFDPDYLNDQLGTDFAAATRFIDQSASEE